jgi:hypothetical protein
VNDGLERIWKWWWPTFKVLSQQEELRKTTKNPVRIAGLRA